MISEFLNDGTQFFTEENVNVNNRIKREQTWAFTCREEAEAKAKQHGSYVYLLYAMEKKGGKEFWGYAVPK